MKSYTFLILILLFSKYTYSSNNEFECYSIQPQNYFGTYTLLSEEKFTASIRDIRKLDTSRIGQTTTINTDLFKHQDIKLENPTYKITCKVIDTEGEVATKKYSNFYGYETDRKEIIIINIHNRKYAELEYSFEIVKHELWDLYDGWIYKYQK